MLRRVEVVNRRCSSCVLIDAYKVLECGQHLNQSMVPLMFKRPRSFRVSPINLPSLRETTLSLGVASSSAYLSSLALLSISLTFSFSLPLSALSFGPPSLFVSSLSYVPIASLSPHVSNKRPGYRSFPQSGNRPATPRRLPIAITVMIIQSVRL